jgi:hypothetical protein
LTVVTVLVLAVAGPPAAVPAASPAAAITIAPASTIRLFDILSPHLSRCTRSFVLRKLPKKESTAEEFSVTDSTASLLRGRLTVDPRYRRSARLVARSQANAC